MFVERMERTDGKKLCFDKQLLYPVIWLDYNLNRIHMHPPYGIIFPLTYMRVPNQTFHIKLVPQRIIPLEIYRQRFLAPYQYCVKCNNDYFRMRQVLPNQLSHSLIQWWTWGRKLFFLDPKYYLKNLIEFVANCNNQVFYMNLFASSIFLSVKHSPTVLVYLIVFQ